MTRRKLVPYVLFAPVAVLFLVALLTGQFAIAGIFAAGAAWVALLLWVTA